MKDFDEEFMKGLEEGSESNLYTIHSELIQIKSLMAALSDVYMTDEQKELFRESFLKRFTNFNRLRNTVPTSGDDHSQQA